MPTPGCPIRGVRRSASPGRRRSRAADGPRRSFGATGSSSRRRFKEGGQPEAAKKGLYFGGNRPAPKDVHRYVVYCLDLDTGKIVWEKEVHRGVPKHGHHLKNSLASETPVSDGERVYAYIGNVGLFCFDFEGNLLWSKRWESVPTRFGWGTAASPVLHGERIYVVNDNEQESFLVALDKKTGERIWRVERDEKSNWATPFVWENEKRTEIVTPGTGKIRSYGLDGELLWELGGMSSHHHSHTLCRARAALRHLRIHEHSASGRCLPSAPARPAISLWKRTRPPTNTSPGVRRRRAPTIPRRSSTAITCTSCTTWGLIACYDARTGEEVYGKRRIGPGARAFTSSPWAYDGKIFCLSEDGDTFVIQAGPEFKLLGKNSLGELCMATPAIVRDGLIIRTESHLLRIK